MHISSIPAIRPERSSDSPQLTTNSNALPRQVTIVTRGHRTLSLADASSRSNEPLQPATSNIEQTQPTGNRSLEEVDLVLQADQDLQASVCIQLKRDKNISVRIPTGTSMHVPILLFNRTLQDPKVVAWFESKGLDLETVRVGKDWVSGNVTDNGVCCNKKFSVWDDSGWWQVSAQLRAVAQALDPADVGLPHMSGVDDSLPCDVILYFYDVSPASSPEEASNIATLLQTGGWPIFNATRRDEALDRAELLINNANSRAQLISDLEESVAGLADDETLSLSDKLSQAANNSPLQGVCLNTLHHLIDFLNLPEMATLTKAHELDYNLLPVRMSEGKLEFYINDNLWYDFTRIIQEQEELIGPFNNLLETVKGSGNALYSNGEMDLQQILNFNEMGSCRSVSEIRNIIRWLKTSLPPAVPLGDCGSRLLAFTPAEGTFTALERTKTIELSRNLLKGAHSIIDALGSGLPLDRSVEYRRANAETMLEQLVATDRASDWGREILKKLEWYGSSAGQSASPDIYDQLLLAAIKLEVDPNTSGKPGNVAGYDIYHPKNLGRDMDAVRAEIEQHLIDYKGVSSQAAPLVAHLFLVDAAPEFLAFDTRKSINIGSSQWLMLRLGVAIAEVIEPGCSRAMTIEQLTDLAMLAPTTAKQQQLFQALAVDVIVAWGVLTGVIVMNSEFSYSSEDYLAAANKFVTQRIDLAQALEAFKLGLTTRRELAVIELGKVFTGLTKTQIENQMIEECSLDDMDIYYPKTERKNFVDAYLDGTLDSGAWQLVDVPMPDSDFTARVARLPKMADVFPASVDALLAARKDAYITATKYLISMLPLEDRQALELGEVRLFALREETGIPDEDETPEIEAAFRGRQGTLLRCEHKQKVSYFEVFPGLMKIIKRTDLPENLRLNGEIGTARSRQLRGVVSVRAQRGTELPFDFNAYKTGSEPKAGVNSPKLIVEELSNLPRRFVTGGNQIEVIPDSYSSDRTARIADIIVNENLLKGEKDALINIGMGQTTEEANRAFWKMIEGFLIQLIPFKGAIEDLRSGERIRIINGVFGFFTDLLSVLGGLTGGAIKISKVALTAAPIRAKVNAAIKQGLLTLVSVVNPLDGVADLFVGTARGVVALNRLLKSGAITIAPVVIERLRTCVDKLRSFFGGLLSEAGGAKLPQRLDNVAEGVEGSLNGDPTVAIRSNGKWYSQDRNGKPFGPALLNFIAQPVAPV